MRGTYTNDLESAKQCGYIWLGCVVFGWLCGGIYCALFNPLSMFYAYCALSFLIRGSK
jgi:hypothetical protein